MWEAFRSELHFSKLYFSHENTRAFIFSPWLPPKWTYQVFYLAYRWLVMLYFLLWLLVTIVHAVDFIKFKYLIFLTHWGFIAWNGYLMLATITATAAYCQDNWSRNNNRDKSNASSASSDSEQLTHGNRRSSLTQTSLNITCKLHWALFLIGGEYAVVITTLYWVFYRNANYSEHNLYSVDSLNLHTINGILAVVDLWVSGVPIRFSHAVYTIGFGCVYVLFTAIYYAVGGKNPEGERFIYPFLDYASNPRAAVALAIGCAVFYVGLIHCVFYLHYVVRKAITGTLSHQACSGEERKCPKEILSDCETV